MTGTCSGSTHGGCLFHWQIYNLCLGRMHPPAQQDPINILGRSLQQLVKRLIQLLFYRKCLDQWHSLLLISCAACTGNYYVVPDEISASLAPGVESAGYRDSEEWKHKADAISSLMPGHSMKYIHLLPSCEVSIACTFLVCTLLHIIELTIITYYYIILHHFYVIILYHYHIITKGNLVMIMIPLLCVMQRWCYHYYVIIASLLLHYYKGSYYYPILLIWVSWLGTCRWCLSLRLMLQYLYPYPINRTGSILVLAAAVFIPHNLELCVLS